MQSILTPSKCALALLMLTACQNQTSVQNSYVSNRDDCQSFAENNIERFVAPSQREDVRVVNAKLVTLFSDCMFDQGWTVATPEREDGDQVAQGPEDDLPQLNDVDAASAVAAARARNDVPPQPVMPEQQQYAPAPHPAPATIMDSDRRAPAAQPVPVQPYSEQEGVQP